MSESSLWIVESLNTVSSYRRIIDAAVVQLSNEQFFARPHESINSVAIILRHLGGNLQSRWTEFLDSDGEKPTRDRDAEFEEWHGSRDSLMEYFDAGWQQFVTTLRSLQPDDVEKIVLIRGERQSVPHAILRAISHISYHVGQIMQVSRMVHTGEWQWVTIAPGASDEFNKSTWGTADSHGVGGASRAPK